MSRQEQTEREPNESTDDDSDDSIEYSYDSESVAGQSGGEFENTYSDEDQDDDLPLTKVSLMKGEY